MASGRRRGVYRTELFINVPFAVWTGHTDYFSVFANVNLRHILDDTFLWKHIPPET
jgi:hypothetical protein